MRRRCSEAPSCPGYRVSAEKGTRSAGADADASCHRLRAFVRMPGVTATAFWPAAIEEVFLNIGVGVWAHIVRMLLNA